MLDIEGTKIMLDCGELYSADKSKFPKDMEKKDIEGLKCIIISHAHLDHTGRLPKIVRFLGYKGPVFCTKETSILLPVMLKMAVKYGDFGMENFYYSKNNVKNRFAGKGIAVHSMPGCEYGSQIGKKGLVKCRRPELGPKGYFLCGKCAEMEAAETMENIVIVKPGGDVKISDTVDAEFFYTSHLPGSVMTLLKDKKSGRNVLYSGDVGSDLSPFLTHNPLIKRRVDIAIVEATYGTAERTDEPDARLKFREYVAKKLKEGKRIIIPVFVLDKSQQVFYELSKGIRDAVIPLGTKITAFSPSMEALNALYCGQLRKEKGNFTGDFLSNGPFDPAQIKFPKGNKIVFGDISVISSGAVDHILSKAEMKKLIGDKNCCFIFISYQDPETVGGIISGNTGNMVEIGGKSYAANAEVMKFDCFSSHAQYGRIMSMLRGFEGLKKVLVVHLEGNSGGDVKKKYMVDLPGVKIIIPQPYVKTDL